MVSGATLVICCVTLPVSRFRFKPFGANRIVIDHAEVRALYEKVTSTIDAQSVAREMFQSNALTVKELQSVQSKHKKPIKAAEQLLNIVMNQSNNVYSCFLDALKKTGHQHVFEVIVSGNCKGTHGRMIITCVTFFVFFVF